MNRADVVEIEDKIDGCSDAVVLAGVAEILEAEAGAADEEGLPYVAVLYRTFAARVEAMAEALEPTVL